MKRTFKPGDVCILQNAKKHHKLNGQEVTVTSELQMVNLEGHKFYGHAIDLVIDGVRLVAEPHQLCRKAPPCDLSTWAHSMTRGLIKLKRVPA